MDSIRKQTSSRRDESVFTRIHRVARSLARGSMSFYLDTYGIGLPHMQIIHTIANHSPLPSTGIVDLTGMNKSLVSRTLAQLTDDGYATDSSDPKDARKRVWTLTPRGQAFIIDVYPVLQERRVEILKVLSPEERSLLTDIMNRLLQSSEALRSKEAKDRSAARRAKKRPKSDSSSGQSEGRH